MNAAQQARYAREQAQRTSQAARGAARNSGASDDAIAQYKNDAFERDLRARGPVYMPAKGSSGLRSINPLHFDTITEYDAAMARASNTGDARERQDRAYRNYVARGVESRDLSAGATTGSYLVPPSLMSSLIEGLQGWSSIVSRAKLWMSTDRNGKPFGGPAQLPTNLDVANNDTKINENTQGSESDFTFGSVSFSNAPIYTGGIGRFGRALMEDSQTDVAQMVNNALAERLGRQLDLDFGATLIAGTTSNVVTTAGASAITLADISALFQKLDPVMIGDPRETALLCSRKTLWYLRTQLVDSSNRPIVSDMALQTTVEDTSVLGGTRTSTVVVPVLYGTPILVSRAFQDLTAGQPVAVLANLQHGFLFRFVSAEVLRLNELYANYGEVGFMGYARADGAVMNQSGALAKLVVHA